MMIRRALLATVGATMILVCALPAQERPPRALRGPTRVPVTLALMDTLADPDGFRILRRAGGDPGDVILLHAGADSLTLSAAIQQLLIVRQAQGDTAQAAAAVRIRQPDAQPRRLPRLVPWAARVMNDLRRAPPRAVSGVGTVASVVIWLPPQRRGNRGGR